LRTNELFSKFGFNRGKIIEIFLNDLDKHEYYKYKKIAGVVAFEKKLYPILFREIIFNHIYPKIENKKDITLIEKNNTSYNTIMAQSNSKNSERIILKPDIIDFTFNEVMDMIQPICEKYIKDNRIEIKNEKELYSSWGQFEIS
jgi:hypothetical protein